MLYISAWAHSLPLEAIRWLLRISSLDHRKRWMLWLRPGAGGSAVRMSNSKMVGEGGDRVDPLLDSRERQTTASDVVDTSGVDDHQSRLSGAR